MGKKIDSGKKIEIVKKKSGKKWKKNVGKKQMEKIVGKNAQSKEIVKKIEIVEKKIDSEKWIVKNNSEKKHNARKKQWKQKQRQWKQKVKKIDSGNKIRDSEK